METYQKPPERTMKTNRQDETLGSWFKIIVSILAKWTYYVEDDRIVLDLCRDAGNFSGVVVLVICLDITRRYLHISSKSRCREAVCRKQTDCKEELGRGWLKAKEKAYCHGDGALHTRWCSLAWAGCGRRLSQTASDCHSVCPWQEWQARCTSFGSPGTL